MDKLTARVLEHYSTEPQVSKGQAALEIVEEINKNKSMTTTLKTLAKRWNWSFKSVERFLIDLNKLKIIDLDKKKGHKTIIKIPEL
jgi:predicted transcriptional regulator